MKDHTIALITGGVWLSAIGSAALLVYALDRPLELRDLQRSFPSKTSERAPERHPAEEPIESAVMQMPVADIGGSRGRATRSTLAGRQGVTEMQPANEVLIGPGIIMHSAAPISTRGNSPKE